MGRRKICIKQIPDVKLRHITFNKRKNGLFKKAAELSVLCNFNLLLICEDGQGNLIQFSKNKITDINSFTKQCSYVNVIELTSEDYPDFIKINKKKDKDKDDSESNMDDEDEPSPVAKPKAKTIIHMAPPQKEIPTRARRMVPEPLKKKEEPITRARHVEKSPMMSEVPTTPTQIDSANAKKSKNKLGLRLSIPKPEPATEPQTAMIPNPNNKIQPIQPIQPVQPNQSSMMELASTPGDKAKKAMAEQIQARFYDTKNIPSLDAQSPFLTYINDPMKKFGTLFDQASPFKMYAQQRMEPLSGLFKGLSPFTFPLNTPLITKGFGEADDKMLDTANALKLFNRGQMGPETGNMKGPHSIYTFQHEDPNNMNNQPNQQNIPNLVFMSNRNVPNQAQTPGQSFDYVNLPSAFKMDTEFDGNIPLDTISARLNNFDGFFVDDAAFGGDLRKKFKMT